MTDPDIDDLLGPDPAEVSAPAVYDLCEVHGGVSLLWLAQVFKMDRQTIKRRLAHCPPIRRHAVYGSIGLSAALSSPGQLRLVWY